MNTLNLISRDSGDNNRQYAYKLLRQNIMTMTLPPGITLNENNISERLGISRTPVHEALISLKSEGLVDIVPQSGSKVTLISLSCVREGLFMRSALEPAIYRQIAGNIDIKFLDAMKANLEHMIQCMSQADDLIITRFIALDDEFHRIAYMAANKPNLWTARLSVCSHYDRIRYHGSVTNVPVLSQIHAEHLQLYEYLLLGDSPSFDLDEYYNLHLGYFKTFFSILYQKNPEFFTN